MMSKEAMKLALEALENNRRTHYYCEDTWYSCPKHEEGCANESEGDECNCGADKANVEIDGAIIALREALAEQPAQQEPVAWIDMSQWPPIRWRDGMLRKDVDQFDGQGLYTSPPAQRTWVDPNDKTQKQYLPHIGEPVLFCHKGTTYMGKHTGGSFQVEVTNQYFNTWECHWMYLPAAHGIKENT